LSPREQPLELGGGEEQRVAARHQHVAHLRVRRHVGDRLVERAPVERGPASGRPPAAAACSAGSRPRQRSNASSSTPVRVLGALPRTGWCVSRRADPRAPRAAPAPRPSAARSACGWGSRVRPVPEREEVGRGAHGEAELGSPDPGELVGHQVEVLGEAVERADGVALLPAPVEPLLPGCSEPLPPRDALRGRHYERTCSGRRTWRRRASVAARMSDCTSVACAFTSATPMEMVRGIGWPSKANGCFSDQRPQLLGGLHRARETSSQVGGDGGRDSSPRPGCLPSAVQAAEKLRALVRKQPIRLRGHPIPLTISIGARGERAGHGRWQSLIRGRHAKLYRTPVRRPEQGPLVSVAAAGVSGGSRFGATREQCSTGAGNSATPSARSKPASPAPQPGDRRARRITGNRAPLPMGATPYFLSLATGTIPTAHPHADRAALGRAQVRPGSSRIRSARRRTSGGRG